MVNEYQALNQGDYEVNNQFVMVPLFIVLLVIMAWCFYLRFVMAFMKRKRLLWVEVQDFENSEYSITRNVAK
jgi:ABC-type sugar transport system permease subunit